MTHGHLEESVTTGEMAQQVLVRAAKFNTQDPHVERGLAAANGPPGRVSALKTSKVIPGRAKVHGYAD